MRNLKKVLALVLALVMAMSLMVTAGATSLGDYSDSNKVTDKYSTAVDVATQLGILVGYDDGKYHPQDTLTRAQLATMTYRIATGDVDDVYTANFAGGAAESFTDTPATAWYAGYVGYAADAGYLKGMGDGTYAPNADLTGYQALAAFLRTIGYNEPGQFTGSDWTVQVAQIAKQVGALDGITGVDLNKAISREVAAQMIYNIIFSDTVKYTPAFGYQTAPWYETLAESEFDLVTGKDGWNANIAPWGRPATIWVAKDGSDVTAAVTIMATPVATYTTAVTQCNLSKDLGKTGTWDAVKWYNGGKSTTSIVATNTKDRAADTAQGTLTEVYKVDGKYQIVEIETWLAQVANVVKATYDKNGHEKTPAETTFTVWDGTAGTPTWKAETEAYAKDSYVLLNRSWFEAANGAVDVDVAVAYNKVVKYQPKLEEGVDYGVLNITTTSPVATAKLADFNKSTAQSVIGGKTYDWAAKYGLNNTGTVGTTYNVYVDQYGNLIGLVVPEDVINYTILDSGIKVTNGFNPYYTAKMLNLSTSKLDEVTVATYTRQDGTSLLDWKDYSVKALNCIVSYEETEDGYALVNAADVWGTNGKVVKGTPRVYINDAVKAVTDAETVYAVETAEGEYSVYTGYANVPSIAGASWIEVKLGDNGYADLVYINAFDATFADGETYAYVMKPGAADVGDGEQGGVAYDIVNNIVINGEVTSVKVVPSFTSELLSLAGKGITLKYNTDGLVCGWADITYKGYTVAQDNSGNVVYLTEGTAPMQGYVVDDASIIWVVDNDNCKAEIGDASDFAKDCIVYAVLAKDDGNSIEKAIVFKTIDD